MISLQKFFGKTDVFYDLLEASAEEAQHSVQILKQLFEQNAEARSIEDFKASRRKDKKITEEINQQLCKVFVSELEREDVENLSNALYKIPKTVEKIAERVLICGAKLQGISFGQQIALMEAAAATVMDMVQQLRKKLHLELIKEMNAKLQQVEGEADKLILDNLRDLYSGKHEPLQAMILKDLYELMEKVVDRCRDAGNVVSHIVLKYT